MKKLVKKLLEESSIEINDPILFGLITGNLTDENIDEISKKYTRIEIEILQEIIEKDYHINNNEFNIICNYIESARGCPTLKDENIMV